MPRAQGEKANGVAKSELTEEEKTLLGKFAKLRQMVWNGTSLIVAIFFEKMFAFSKTNVNCITAYLNP